MVVMDTNILMSHPAVVERAFDALAAPCGGEWAGLEVQALVPWVVLSELDLLKHRWGGLGGPGA